MANEDQIYSFEENFLDALQSIISVAGAQTVIYGQTDTHETPRIEVSFVYDGANNLDRGLTSDGKQYLRTHNGTIGLSIFGTERSPHLQLVGKVRNFMAWNVPKLIQPTLAYYQVQSIFEQSSENGAADPEADFEIYTDLNFNVRFQIPPSAFNA